MDAQLNVSLVSHTPNIEELITLAAKLCYSPHKLDYLIKNQTTSETLIKSLIDMNHESPLEHATFTFAIEGVSRSLTHQLVRHRLASYSQQSQRYVNASDFNYITPPSIQASALGETLYTAHMNQTKDTYVMLYNTLLLDYCSTLASPVDTDDPINYIKETNLDLFKRLEKKAYEDARYVLPNGTETKIIMTMNVRSLHHFLEQRLCNRAQWEIRQLATEMHALCKGISPLLFSKIGAPCKNGKCTQDKYKCTV